MQVLIVKLTPSHSIVVAMSTLASIFLGCVLTESPPVESRSVDQSDSSLLGPKLAAQGALLGSKSGRVARLGGAAGPDF